MKGLMCNLLSSYRDYLFMINEYNVLNDKLKDYVKLKNNKVRIKDYSLKIMERDISTYSNEVVDYLSYMGLSSFLKKEVDNRKIKSSIEKGILNKEDILDNITADKTVLDIVVPSLSRDIEYYKESLIKEERDILSMIERRVELKKVIETSKWDYFRKANLIKDTLRSENLDEYRFKIEDLIGLVRIRIVGRVYDEDFLLDCTNKGVDVFKYEVDNKKLRASKIKKIISDDYIAKCKIEKKTDYLYIRRLEKRTVS